MSALPRPPRGRGAADNPPNRFETTRFELDPDTYEPPESDPSTELIPDHARTVIATNDSPDVGFEASLNPYRGCEHGCIYCYARPLHEYLGYSAGLDFETRLLVKYDAPELLRRELSAPGWAPKVLAIGGATDAYQPVERRLRITRRCLEVAAEFRNPIVIITKSLLVARDADILSEMARFDAAAVYLSITSLDADLSRRLEPRASLPTQRLEAVHRLSAVGVPVGVLVAPTIPGLNDHEIPAILNASAQAGARFAGYVLLRLPGAVAGLFESWLDRHAPGRKDRVLNRLRAMRGGRLNDPRFGHRMSGSGPLAEAISTLFAAGCRRSAIPRGGPSLSTSAFRRSGARGQRWLFD
jgi:DNA repair photolyase